MKFQNFFLEYISKINRYWSVNNFSLGSKIIIKRLPVFAIKKL